MIVLHHYVKGRREDDQAVTWRGLNLCREVDGVTVRDVAAYSDYSWAVEMNLLWGRGESIVNVDMDIAIYPWHLEQFAACEEQACTFAYYINTADAPHRRPGIVHRALHAGAETPINEGDWWADRIGGGLFRVRPELQDSIVPTPPVPMAHFMGQDSAFSERMNVEWHVHWPAVAHHHLWL